MVFYIFNLGGRCGPVVKFGYLVRPAGLGPGFGLGGQLNGRCNPAMHGQVVIMTIDTIWAKRDDHLGFNLA